MNNTFRDFISSFGYTPPEFIPTGKIVRFGKKKHLWAMLFIDGDCGVFGDWKGSGKQFIWRSDHKTLSKQEQLSRAKELASIRQKVAKEREQEYQQVALKAQEIYAYAKPFNCRHPYLVKKKINLTGGIKQHHSNLLIPVEGEDGNIQTIQYISDKGSKIFLKGGKVKGGFHRIGEIEQSETPRIYIAEGFATGHSIHEDSGGNFVVVALSASNLEQVALIFRRQYPKAQIIICGDNDPTGLNYAKKASQLVRGSAVFPPAEFNDWNDYLTGENK